MKCIWGSKFLLMVLLSPGFTWAQSLPQTFNFDGILTDGSDAPITTATSVTFQIVNPAGDCLLFEETHASVTPQADGAFSLKVGGGGRTGNDPGHGWALIFQNSTAFATNTNCPSGYTPVAGHDRKLKVLVGGVPLNSGDFSLSSAPMATVAETLQGRTPADLVQVRDDATFDLNQINIETVFSSANYLKLTALLAGDSSSLSSPTTSVGFNNQRIINVAAPAAASDAANKSYVDTLAASVGGRTTDLSGVGVAAGDGQTLIWDQAGNRWITGNPVATDATKLPLAGGTMTGVLNMGAYNIENIGHITMAAQRTLNLGTYTSIQESTLTGPLGPIDKGKTWFNSDMNTMRVWDGTSAVSLAAGGSGITALMGDVTATGSGSVTATIMNNAVTSAKINDSGIAVNRLVATDNTTGNSLTYMTCAIGEFLKWTPSGWACEMSAWNPMASDTWTMGKVGIGSSVPMRPLEVQGGMRLVPSTMPGPAYAGDIIVDSGDTNKLKWYDGVGWQTIAAGAVGDFRADGSVAMINPLRAATGTAAMPSVTFSVDPDTGLYNDGPNALGIAIGGIPKYLFNSNYMSSNTSGSYLISAGVGIPTGPTYSWNTDADTGMFHPVNDTVAFSTTGIERVRIMPSGQVGIGTNAPLGGAILDVNGTGSSSAMIIPRGNSARPTPVDGMLRYNTDMNEFEGVASGTWKPLGVEFPILSPNAGTQSSPDYSFQSDPNVGMFSSGAGRLGFSTAGMERLLIDSTGNIGIGTSAPAARIQVVSEGAGPSAYFTKFDSVAMNRVVFQSARGTAVGPAAVGPGDKVLSLASKGHHGGAWHTNIGAEMSFEASENYVPGAQGTRIVFHTTPNASTAITPRMTISEQGNVGIGTATPVAMLDLNGEIRLRKNVAQPTACSPSVDGVLALTSVYRMCVCKGSNSTWVQTTDGTTACTW